MTCVTCRACWTRPGARRRKRDRWPWVWPGSAYLLYGSGDVDAVCGRLCGAIALRPEPYDPADATLSEALQALHTLLLACFFGGGPVLWSRFDAAVARYPAVPVLLATARSTFADPAHASPSDLPELDAAITGLADESDPLRIVRVALAGIYVDRLGGCAEGLRRVAAGGRRGENITPAICALFLLGIEAWQAGQWPELRQLAREGLDLCDEYRYPALAWLGKFLLACAAAACGDDAEALSLAGQMDQWAEPRRAYTVRAWAARAKALSALGRGDFDEAYQQAVLVAPTGTLPEFASHAVWMVLDLAEAAVRTGRCQQARDHVAAASGAGLGALSPRLRMLLHAASALAAGDDRHPGFRDALAVEGAGRWPFDLARIQLYYGEQLRRGGGRARAHRAGLELRACGGPPRAACGPVAGVTSRAALGDAMKQLDPRLGTVGPNHAVGSADRDRDSGAAGFDRAGGADRGGHPAEVELERDRAAGRGRRAGRGDGPGLNPVEHWAAGELSGFLRNLPGHGGGESGAGVTGVAEDGSGAGGIAVRVAAVALTASVGHRCGSAAGRNSIYGPWVWLFLMEAGSAAGGRPSDGTTRRFRAGRQAQRCPSAGVTAPAEGQRWACPAA